MLGVSEGRVRQLVREDRIPHERRPNGRIWFRLDLIESHAAARAQSWSPRAG